MEWEHTRRRYVYYYMYHVCRHFYQVPSGRADVSPSEEQRHCLYTTEISCVILLLLARYLEQDSRSPEGDELFQTQLSVTLHIPRQALHNLSEVSREEVRRGRGAGGSGFQVTPLSNVSEKRYINFKLSDQSSLIVGVGTTL